MTKEELGEVIRLHGLYLNGDPKGKIADFRSSNLRGADFRSSNLIGTNFGNSNLRGADFRNANLISANFRNSNLSGADFRGPNLKNADFRNSNLRGVDFRNANLRGVGFRDSNLEGADFRNSNLIDADFRNSNLRGVDFRNANLRGVDFRNSNLISANLEPIKKDMFDVLLRAIPEISALKEAVKSGKIEGSTYQGECACLCGTIEKSKRIQNTYGESLRDAMRPIERFFLTIVPGDTPENSYNSKLALEWIEEFESYIGVK